MTLDEASRLLMQLPDIGDYILVDAKSPCDDFVAVASFDLLNDPLPDLGHVAIAQLLKEISRNKKQPLKAAVLSCGMVLFVAKIWPKV